jgi:hypothetical protein
MVGNMTGYDPTWDLAVLRNVTIQRTAEGMREIDRLYQARQYESAWRIAVALERQLANVTRLTDDVQLREDVNLMQHYQKILADVVWQAQGREPRLAEDVPFPPERGNERSVENPPTPTSSVPRVEIR